MTKQRPDNGIRPDRRELACCICGKVVTALLGMASDRESVCGFKCLVAVQDARCEVSNG